LASKQYFHRGTNVFIPVKKKSLPCACSQQVTELASSRRFCISVASQVLFKGIHTVNQKCGGSRPFGWRVMNRHLFSLDLANNEFLLFGVKKHLACKRYERDTNIKQAVTSCLPGLDTNFF
jgi:hypothetical protein